METLIGFPTGVYTAVPDGLKSKRINAVAKAIGDYLHAGRHVAKDGPREGEFDVDHRDAQFALALTKSLLALLTPPPEAQALSEAVQLARAALRDAAAKGDYPRAAAEGRREKELTRELDERLRAWRQTFQ
jgi:hypothetical protein